jgi:hypothetical protein
MTPPPHGRKLALRERNHESARLYGRMARASLASYEEAKWTRNIRQTVGRAGNP